MDNSQLTLGLLSNLRSLEPSKVSQPSKGRLTFKSLITMVTFSKKIFKVMLSSIGFSVTVQYSTYMRYVV